MALTPNSSFGTYRIGGTLGVGGMGEVYRATDTTLEREVALKVLPESFASDAERIVRFEREAKSLAALNHPNIAQIYGLEKQGTTTALVMELVEGPTLADRIAEGPLPPEEALRIAYQLLDGLEAAHARGIVHRDLKPANIKVKADGHVKILDFGIAKSIDVLGSSGGARHSPTMVTPAATESGVIMGTAAYMSPEQARGKFVDQRSDIWAFGCVLYEMLTGQPAFGGEDVMTTLARVLDRDTDLGALPRTLTPAARQTLKLCLRKDAKKRFHHIADVRMALAGEFDTGVAQQGSVATQALWKKLVPLAATFVVAVGITAFFLQDTAPVAEVRRSVQTLPVDQPLNFPVLTAIALAADDSRMVYGAAGGLYLRDMDELEPRVIPGTENENPLVPAFSPDGDWIAYATGTAGGVSRVSVEGGTPLPVLATLPSNGFTWTDANTLLYGNENELWKVTADGGSPELLFTDTTGFDVGPSSLLPGGDLVLFWRRTPDRSGSDIAVASISTGELTILFPGTQPIYLDSGHLAYFDTSLGLMARSFDPSTLAYGSPIVMSDDILRVQKDAGASQFNISANGSLLYVKGKISAGGSDMLAIANETDVTRQLNAPSGTYLGPSASPDGSQLAVAGAGQIYVYRVDGSSELRQLTREGTNRMPVWTPDGDFITYASARDGPERIYRQRADGSGVAEALTAGVEGKPQVFPAWSPDGRLTYSSPNEDDELDIWIVAIPLGEPELLIGGRGSQRGVTFAPDGRSMAYDTNESGIIEVMAAPFPPDGSSTRLSEVGVNSFLPVWARQGSRLYYQTPDASQSLIAVDITLPGFAVTSRRNLPYFLLPDARRFDSMPGGDELLVAMPPQDVAGTAGTELIFVENWIEEVKRRVPR